MKKLVLCAALFVFFVTIGVTVYVLINIASIGNSEAKVTVYESENNMPSAIEQYAAENYPDYAVKYDAVHKTLTLKKQTDFSLESAPSVYDDTSDYLDLTKFIAFDISSVCNEKQLIVIITYLSKDGEPMLSVGSDGTITQHWK